MASSVTNLLHIFIIFVSFSGVNSETPSEGSCPSQDKIYIILSALPSFTTLVIVITILWYLCHKFKTKNNKDSEKLLGNYESSRDEEFSTMKSSLDEKLSTMLQDLQKILDKKQKDTALEQEKLQNLSKEIDKRKALYKSAWKNAPLYPDWRKEEFKVVNIILDELSAHPNLLLSKNFTRIAWRKTDQDHDGSTQRFDSLPGVLGQLKITRGRFYWEVEVGDTHSWDLGICRDDATRKGRVTVSPQNGFWAIRMYDREYWALSSPETRLTMKDKPLRIGIFLDFDDGDVSFYNMTDNSHIFSFPKFSFSGTLRPFFRLWPGESDGLTIVQMKEN